MWLSRRAPRLAAPSRCTSALVFCIIGYASGAYVERHRFSLDLVASSSLIVG
jgi:hypothetical protein